MSEKAFVRTFTVAGFTAEVTFPHLERGQVASAVVEWSPRPPDLQRDFTVAERQQYRLALIAALSEGAR